MAGQFSQDRTPIVQYHRTACLIRQPNIKAITPDKCEELGIVGGSSRIPQYRLMYGCFQQRYHRHHVSRISQPPCLTQLQYLGQHIRGIIGGNRTPRWFLHSMTRTRRLQCDALNVPKE